MKKWYCFISQTGTELKTISECINRIPDIIITNNIYKISSLVLNWIDNFNITLKSISKNPIIDDYINLNLDKNSIITLHGYLRIIPPNICDIYNIYNGHPGLINYYPELKGFNPQEKAYNLKMTHIGSVIHRVTPIVDNGEIILYDEKIVDFCDDISYYYNILRETSLNTWKRFFNEYITW